MSESTVLERLSFQPDWADVESRARAIRARNLRRQALVAVGMVAVAAILAAGAYAAVHAIWRGHDLTPADIERQATTVYNDKWSVCDGKGRCTDHTGTHKQVDILPSMGVVFVLPDGDTTSVIPGLPGFWDIPAAGGLAPGAPPPHDDSGKTWGAAHPLTDGAGGWSGGVWTIPLPSGGTRTITWKAATGSMSVADRAGGVTTTTQLTAGDVVPLIPGTLGGHPRTLDKAVTFDLPTGNRVMIFPRLNETYINWVTGPAEAEPLGRGVAARYGLAPVGEYDGKLPVTSRGGTWTAHIPGGLTRTISWRAGNSFVTVEDKTATGTTTTEVPIGHELPLVPFK